MEEKQRFCSKCGAPVNGSFCTKCGTPIKSENKTQGPAKRETPPKDKESKKKSNIWIIAVLIAVVAIGCVIFFMNRPVDNSITNSSESGVKEETSEAYSSTPSSDDSNEINNLSEFKGFYGVWCGASRQKTEMMYLAKDVMSFGFDAVIVNTSDWSNLNNSGWFAVSAGKYENEQAANQALIKAKKNYPNAYVKYTGDYLNNTNQENGNEINNVYSISYIDYLLTMTSEREIREDELDGLSHFEVAAVRNGVYAVHGYVFQTKKWNDFYSKYFYWYQPNPSFKQGSISAIESRNVTMIKNYEIKHFGKAFSF